MELTLAELNSDDLGEAAESFFLNLCAKAQLTANKSSRDRHGWDFLVEAAPAEDSKVPLDKRAAGLSCLVQVKGIVRGEDRVHLRLSSAERLAKDPKPAFIVVLRMNRAGDVNAGHVIHLLGKPLGKLLERLRKAQADGDLAVNKATITYDQTKLGERFDLTGPGLRQALASGIGDSMDAYVSEKSRQLSSLGYESHRFELDASFEFSDRSEMVDVFLGLKPTTPLSLASFDTRFGIRLPVDTFKDLAGSTLLIKPEANHRCQVTIRGAPLIAPAIFDGAVTAPPSFLPITEDEFKVLVRTEFFTLTYSSLVMRYDGHAEVGTESRGLLKWQVYLRALTHLASGKGFISARPDGFVETIDIPLSKAISGDVVDALPTLSKAAEDARKMLEHAGLSPDVSITIDELGTLATPLAYATSLMLQAPPTSPFGRLGAFPDGTKDHFDALYGDELTIGGSTIQYAARFEIARPSGDDAWHVLSATPIDVRSAVTPLETYLSDQAREHKIGALMHGAHSTPSS